MFYDNLKQVCKSKGTSVTAVIKQIGLNPTSGTYWKKGSFPSGDILIKLSEALEVSTDYLLKGTETLPAVTAGDVSGNYNNIIGNGSNVTITVTGQGAELLKIFNGLPPIEQAKLLLYADELSKNKKLLSSSSEKWYNK